MEIIGENAFWNCYELKSLSLPNSLIKINDCAFTNCQKLENLVLPKKLAYIGKDAFSSCNNLYKVIIPISVTYIGESAFGEYSWLTICCEANSKPYEWHQLWTNNSNIVWGYTE